MTSYTDLVGALWTLHAPHLSLTVSVNHRQKLVLSMLGHHNTNKGYKKQNTFQQHFLWRCYNGLCDTLCPVQDLLRKRQGPGVDSDCWLAEVMLPARRCIYHRRGHHFPATSTLSEHQVVQLGFRSVMDTHNSSSVGVTGAHISKFKLSGLQKEIMIFDLAWNLLTQSYPSCFSEHVKRSRTSDVP